MDPFPNIQTLYILEPTIPQEFYEGVDLSQEALVELLIQ